MRNEIGDGLYWQAVTRGAALTYGKAVAGGSRASSATRGAEWSASEDRSWRGADVADRQIGRAPSRVQ
jgi:hypothetical protein